MPKKLIISVGIRTKRKTKTQIRYIKSPQRNCNQTVIFEALQKCLRIIVRKQAKQKKKEYNEKYSFKSYLWNIKEKLLCMQFNKQCTMGPIICRINKLKEFSRFSGLK